jgi:hypothetical protein
MIDLNKANLESATLDLFWEMGNSVRHGLVLEPGEPVSLRDSLAGVVLARSARWKR